MCTLNIYIVSLYLWDFCLVWFGFVFCDAIHIYSVMLSGKWHGKGGSLLKVLFTF